MTIDGPAFRRADWERALHGTDAPRSRPEFAAERLAALAEHVDPGTWLGTKEGLRARLGISAGSFNEALRLVQARGQVNVRSGPGGGLFASRQSAMVRLGNSVLSLADDEASMAEALRIRQALDPLLIDDVLRHATAEDLQAMHSEVELMESAALNEDAASFVKATSALYQRIAESSPNGVLRSIYIGLLDLIASHTLSIEADGEVFPREQMTSHLDLHSELVKAIASRDQQRAHALMNEHNDTLQTTAEL